MQSCWVIKTVIKSHLSRQLYFKNLNGSVISFVGQYFLEIFFKRHSRLSHIRKLFVVKSRTHSIDISPYIKCHCPYILENPPYVINLTAD